MIRFLILCMNLTLASTAFPESPMSTPAGSPTLPGSGIIVPLWPDGKMPGHGSVNPESHNNPGPDGLLRISDVSQPTIEIFKAPGAATRPVPAMIICPGGGYGILAYNREGTDIAAWLNSIGITGIVLKYRIPNNRDGALQDIERAMCLARQHAAEWKIEANKLGVIGFSAGGHLSARLGNHFEKPAYPELDAADKLSCRPDFIILVYPGYLADTGQLAPEMTITSATPRTLIVHSEDDLHHVAGSKIYDAALAAAGVPHQFLLYSTGGHGVGLRSQKEMKVWPDQAAEWLRKIGIL